MEAYPRSFTVLTSSEKRNDRLNLPDKGLLCDLLWSDPREKMNGWADSDRGAGRLFDANVVFDFCEKNGIDLIVRGHEVVTKGYKFFAYRRLVMVFSAANYVGTHRNAAAMLLVDENLKCRFKQMKKSSRRNGARGRGRIDSIRGVGRNIWQYSILMYIYVVHMYCIQICS